MNNIAALMPAESGEKDLDTMISVDRTAQLTYPKWAVEVLHPELEAFGPAKYDLSKVELYFYDEQKNDGRIVAKRLYDHLVETDTLKDCLGLHDAMEIQKKGAKVFRRLFGKNGMVLCWKSIARSRDTLLHVLFVCSSETEVMVCWYFLGNIMLLGRDPTCRFTSEQLGR